MKSIKIIALTILFILPSVLALQRTNQCLNSSYLESKIEWVECDNSCINYNITQVTNCTYGCDYTDEKCKPPPYQVSLYMAIGVIVLIVVVAIVVKK